MRYAYNEHSHSIYDKKTRSTVAHGVLSENGRGKAYMLLIVNALNNQQTLYETIEAQKKQLEEKDKEISQELDMLIARL